MLVLGVNAPPVGWHDQAACLVENGSVLAFVEQERLSRRKHALHEEGPRLAVAHCLRASGRRHEEVDVVAVGWNMPLVSLRFGGPQWSLEETPGWLRTVLGWPTSTGRMPEVRFVSHHLAHASVAFFASDFEQAAVLVTDGNGDDESISIYAASRDRGVARKQVWSRGESVGWMYDAACESAGLTFHEAGKLMGLASYGQAAGIEPWELLPDGEPREPRNLPAGYHYREAVACWRAEFDALASSAPVQRDRADLHFDDTAVRIAWSAQNAVEGAVQRLSALAREAAGTHNLCLAGGVALNCKANGLLGGPAYIPPIPHDAGVALGAAWSVSPPTGAVTDSGLLSPYLGPGPASRSGAASEGLRFEPLDLDLVCGALENGCVGGIVDGAAEVGPRALGHRSIIASPARGEMRDKLNRVKGREPWRPFGAAALPERARDLWDERWPLTKYMLAGVRVKDAARPLMAAATHVDGSTRPQVVCGSGDDLLHRLLESWDSRAGGALINTSFNGGNEPIVSSSDDALATFRAMELDFVILPDEVVSKRREWWKGPDARRPDARARRSRLFSRGRG